jgi:hypothetical protein
MWYALGAMAEPTILTWSFTNWVTVVLMVALAGFVVAAGVKVYQQQQNGA